MGVESSSFRKFVMSHFAAANTNMSAEKPSTSPRQHDLLQ